MRPRRFRWGRPRTPGFGRRGLAADGATADPGALDQWLRLVSGIPAHLDTSGPAVPGGLAIKMLPCCYAMQRPIRATVGLAVEPDDVTAIVVRTPRGTVQPLIHHAPTTGLEAKFSLEYALAAALLDGRPGFASFTDAAVQRAEARRVMSLVRAETSPGGDGLLAGEAHIEVWCGTERLRSTLRHPPGSPQCPPGEDDLATKTADCTPELSS